VSAVRQTYVYFVRRSDGEGPVKIGCSYSPPRRLLTLATWAPYPLEVAATMPGDTRLERRFHAMFAAQHCHREWFHSSPELEATIVAVAAGTFDTDALPAPGYLYSRPTNNWSEDTRRHASWTHRLLHLERRNVEVPRRIYEALQRYSWGVNPKRDPADAAIVEGWLEQYPRVVDQRRKAA
jgi:hypothetical protein